MCTFYGLTTWDACLFWRTRSMAFQEYLQLWFQRSVMVTPNPDYPIPANLWDLNIPFCASLRAPCRRSFVIATRCRVHTIHRMAGNMNLRQTQIQDEQERSQKIEGMTEDIMRAKRLSMFRIGSLLRYIHYTSIFSRCVAVVFCAIGAQEQEHLRRRC